MPVVQGSFARGFALLVPLVVVNGTPAQPTALSTPAASAPAHHSGFANNDPPPPKASFWA